MARFILMLRDSGWNPEELSPEDIQNIIERYGAWMQRIRATGNKLRDDEGRVVRRNGSGLNVTDGPYAEAKEIIGGFVVVEAADYDEAVQLCKDSPHFDFGPIEIRQIEETGG
jgi:hypothetical protein